MRLVISCYMVINRGLKEDNGYCGENGKRRKNELLDAFCFNKKLCGLCCYIIIVFLKQINSLF